MSSYEPYDRDRDHSRRYVREERRDDRDTRFYDRDRYDSRQYGSSRDLVPRVAREDSELSVEEIQRGFPPPTGRDIRRQRSSENYYDDDYDSRYDSRYDDRRSSRRGPASIYHEEEEVRKSKGMSKNEKIMAAVAGAALLVGGKELYDRHEAKDGHKDVQRNALSSAALAGVGALAAYQGAEFYSKQQAKKDQKATYILHRGRDGQVQEYYSDDDEDPKQKKGNKNFLESALAATGLGAAVKSLTGGDKDKDKDDRSDTRSRAGDRDGDDKDDKSGGNKIQKAAMASLLAGATEAFRVAKEPGGWQGEKTKRILTAAAGAAAVDSAQSGDHGKLGMAQSVIGGLVGNRLVNGSKNDIEEDKATGRSRSRSRARSQSGGMSGATGLAALATAGLGAVGAKKAYDGYQDSRSRSRGRAPSDGSRSPSPQKRSRSRSVVDRARNSLAKLGIGAGAGGAGALAVDDGRRRDQDDYSDRGSRRGSRRYSDEYDDDYRSSRYDRERDRDYYDDDRSYRGSGRRDRSRRRDGRSEYTSESDLGDSDDDVKKQKRLREHRRY